MSRQRLWINYGVNMLLRGSFAEVPNAYARQVAEAAEKELGIVTSIRARRRGRARLIRTGVKP
jgi:hypothetical protein